MIRRALGLALAVFVAFVLPHEAQAAPSATVERHAICWSPTEQVDYWHWAIWTTGPRDTNYPCKVRWSKGYITGGPFGWALPVHKHRTFGNLPDPGEGQL